MKSISPITRHVAYVTSVDVVDNCRAHALQMMKNGSAWWQVSKKFELITNLTLDHWCRLDPWQIAHHYGLPAPLPITAFPLFNLETVSLAGLSTLYYRLVARYCRWRNISLAYCRSYEAAYWLCRQGVFTLLESHGIPPDPNHVARLPALSNSPSFAGLVTITPPLQEMFVQAGVNRDKIIVLPDGVDLHRFANPLSRSQAREKLALDDSRPLALYTGHLYEGRGIEEIMQAAQLLPDVQFIMVGGMANHVALWLQKTRSAGINTIQWSGHVANTLLPPYLWAADVLLMPYNSHCSTAGWMSPMKLFEYMAAGRAIVASDLPVLHTVLSHGRNGWLVPADDGTALAQGIRHLLVNAPLRETLAQQASQDVIAYDWQARVLRIIDLLEKK